MNNEQVIYENKTIFTKDIVKDYIKYLRKNVYVYGIIGGAFFIFLLLVAIFMNKLAYIPLGFLTLCIIVAYIFNKLGIKKTIKSFEEGYDDVYEFKFYTDHLDVMYYHKDSFAQKTVNYQSVKDVTFTKKMAIISLYNGSVFFVQGDVNDESFKNAMKEANKKTYQA